MNSPRCISRQPAITGLIPAVILLRHVRTIIKCPWRGRYAAITKAGDSLLHISPSCVHSVRNLSRRTRVGREILGESMSCAA